LIGTASRGSCHCTPRAELLLLLSAGVGLESAHLEHGDSRRYALRIANHEIRDTGTGRVLSLERVNGLCPGVLEVDLQNTPCCELSVPIALVWLLDAINIPFC
jgi:hypothetical protein